MTEHCQVIDIMRNRNVFNREHAVRPIVHPTRVVRLHLQGVDECRVVTVVHQEVCESLMGMVFDHRHYLGRRT